MKKREDTMSLGVMRSTAIALAVVFAAARCSGGGPGGESTTSTQASSGSETPAASDTSSASPAPADSQNSSAAPSSTAECATDEDCVRDACCHATACVPRARAPQCTGIMCTRNCQAGSLDCGGSCACEAGHCVGHRAQ